MIVLALAAVLVGGVIAFFRSESGSLAALLQKMAEILDGARATMPAWALDWLPADGSALRDDAVSWLRGHAAGHAAEVKAAGGEAGRVLAY